MFKYLFRHKYKSALFAIGGIGVSIALTRSPNSFLNNDPHEYIHGPVFPTNKKLTILPSREQHINRLKSEEIFDLLVIGGGSAGTGVALDAVSRGLSVALVEKDDFSSGSSSRSTKLIHGGVRYLEKAFKKLDIKQLNLVIDALNERKHMISITPHLSYEIPIIVPIYYHYPEALFYLPYFWIGMKMYDIFAGSKGQLKPSRYISKKECLEEFPMLNDKGLKGAILYYDGMHNDARMNISLALTAANKGGTIANHVEMRKLIKTNGKISGATLFDKNSGETWDIKCKAIVNATGYFSDQTRKIDDPKCKSITAPSAGVHIVIPSYYSPKRMGLLIPNTDDGRIVFLLPWEGSTIAGTTDNSCQIVDLPRPTTENASFIVSQVKKYLNTNLTTNDIDACWSGIRPLAKDIKCKDTKSISRDHVIHISNSGLVTITGGKWTTYRKMAEDVVDKVLEKFKDIKPKKKECSTRHMPLIGTEGWSLSLSSELERMGIDKKVSSHLSHNYGFQAYMVAEIALKEGLNKKIAKGYDFIEAEIIYGIRNEYAMNTVDIIARRLRLAFLNTEATFEALPNIISIMGKEKNWTTQKRISEYDDACNYLKTMNVTIQKKKNWIKHDWENYNDKIKLLFNTDSPLSAIEIEKMHNIYTKLIKINNKKDKALYGSNANDFFEKVANDNKKLRKYAPQLTKKYEPLKLQQISFEEFVYGVCSEILLDK